ncbi:hypothetical protein YQE_10319, partial [Dendroctonus ponderosae]
MQNDEDITAEEVWRSTKEDFQIDKRLLMLNEKLERQALCQRNNGGRICANSHEYSDPNPHITINHNYQREFGVNVWAGIVGRYLVSNFEIDGYVEEIMARNAGHRDRQICEKMHAPAGLATGKESKQ